MNKYHRSKKARRIRKFSIIVMRDHMNMTLQEIGEVLGITGQRVRIIYHNAMRDRENYLKDLAAWRFDQQQRQIRGLGEI